MRFQALIIAILVAGLCGPASADLYKWKDENGKWHFTDSPPPSLNSQDAALERMREVAPATKPLDKTASVDRKVSEKTEKVPQVQPETPPQGGEALPPMEEIDELSIRKQIESYEKRIKLSENIMDGYARQVEQLEETEALPRNSTTLASFEEVVEGYQQQIEKIEEQIKEYEQKIDELNKKLQG